MPKLFRELREQLLRAGVAPRHVRRYLAELQEHLADLVAEELRTGRTPADAETAALARLGSVDDLAQAMLRQPALRAWSARAPWAVVGLGPAALVALAYGVALLILWSGWRMYLPGAATPFGAQNHPGLLGMAYFALGRNLCFAAPFLAGWAVAFLAERQRLQPLWPAAGMLAVALLGGMAQVHALRIAGVQHVGLSLEAAPNGFIGALVILVVVAVPWGIARVRRVLHAQA
jgi:hypothetical protein